MNGSERIEQTQRTESFDREAFAAAMPLDGALRNHAPGRSGRPPGQFGGRGRHTVPRTVSMTREETNLYDRFTELTGLGITELVRTFMTPRVRAAVWLAEQADLGRQPTDTEPEIDLREER